MANKPVLVLGATGSFGGAVALELLQRGGAVRALVRDEAKARVLFGGHRGLEFAAGDARDPGAVDRAAAGCGAIVHGINFPYDQWSPNMYVVTENVVGAAEAEGALVVFPGNVYGLGDQTGRPLDEAAENAPCSAKGVIRVDLETSLRQAAEAGAARVLIVRAGDYFGPTMRNGLVDPIFGNAAKAKPMRALGRLDMPHQWAYLPDLARAVADLMEKPGRLALFEVVHFAGHVAETEGAFLRLVAAASGHPDLPVGVAPWWMLRLAGLFSGVVREVMEMRYLFDGAVILDEPRLRELLPRFKATPIEVAVRDTLQSYRTGRPLRRQLDRRLT